MKKLYLAIAILAIIGFLGISAYQIFSKSKKPFEEKNVTLKIEGPQSLEMGESFDIAISYKNDNKVNLKNAVLTLNFPRGNFDEIKDESGFGKIKDSAVIWEIGDMAQGYEGSVKISAKAGGAVINNLAAELSYIPENFNSEFSVKSEYSFTTKPAKISLSIFAPREAAAGQEMKYIVTYTNATAVNFDAIKIRINYPAGFVFSQSLPSAGEDGTWEVLNFGRASSGQIEVLGMFSGTTAEAKTITAVVNQKERDGSFVFNNEISADTSLINAPFIISQVVNDKENYSASAGEMLNYKLKLRNLDKDKKNNLIFGVALSGDAADFESMAAAGAAVNKELRTITWDAKNRSDLAAVDPDKELDFSFSVKVKEKIAAADGANKNFSIKSTASVKDGNIFDAGGGNKVIISFSSDVKINSPVEIFTRGYYNDDGRISTFGPIPPKVGETTAYNIKWQILNPVNKIKNAKVVGVLPEGVRWSGEVFPPEAKISYDVNTRTVVWEAGDIEAGTGVLSPLKEVVFQVDITPRAGDVGNYIVLVSQNKLTAVDDFTLNNIEAKSEGVTTRLPDDVSIGPDEGKVVVAQ